MFQVLVLLLRSARAETSVPCYLQMSSVQDDKIKQTYIVRAVRARGFHRYAITRLMEQMLLSKRKEVKLQPWEEIIGTLKTIETDNQTITAVVACTQNLEIALPYLKDTLEATTIQNLNKNLGQKIAILKTDNPQQPLTIRTYTATPRSLSQASSL